MASVTYSSFTRFRKTMQPSRIVWVEDGVVLEEEALRHLPEAYCCLTIFVSAEGLQKDLSTLNLTESPGKLQRREKAASTAVKLLDGFVRGTVKEVQGADTAFTSDELFSQKTKLWGLSPRSGDQVQLAFFTDAQQYEELEENFRSFSAALQSR